MTKKAKLFLVAPNDIIRNLGVISDTKLRKAITNFIIQFDFSNSKKKYSGWDNWNTTYTKDIEFEDYPGTFNTRGMSSSYQEYLTEQKFEDILDEFITGLLAMNNSEKSEFLKSLEKITKPIDKSEVNSDNIYNIVNTIYYKYSDNDIFNSVKVSKLEKTDTIVLSSYNLTSIEKIKAKLIKEGIENIRYRIVKNPYNQKKIHTIMYDRIGEK